MMERDIHRVLPSQARALLALALLVPVPSVGTYMAMVAMPDTTFGQTVFTAGKLWVAVLPVVWLVLVDRGVPRIPKPTKAGAAAGCVTGVGIVAVIALAYGLAGDWAIDRDVVREQAAAVGLASPWMYLLGAIYWCTINSLMEEYVWRWFVFTRCEILAPKLVAVGLSALFFTLHHIIALQVYFDWTTTVLASLGVFGGGAIWSWIYLRYRDIWGAYISHLFADVIIFAIGYRLIFGA